MRENAPDEEWLPPRRILGLVAGRAIYRLATYGTGIALLAIWGSSTFATYAAPIGATGWVLNAVGGTEKAAQTFLPRDPLRRLELFFVLAAVIPYALLVLAWAVADVVVHANGMVTYLAAAALACGVGGTSALVALFRMRGRPYVDAVTYVHLSLGYVLGVLAVAWLGLDVGQLFAVLVVWQTSAYAVLVLRFRRQDVGTGGAAGDRWSALRAIPLLSASDLATAVGASILYVELTWGPDRRVLSTFYVAAVLLTVVAMVWTYLLRLFQPGLVRRIVAGGAVRAVVLGRRVVSLGTGFGVVCTAALALATWWAGSDSLVIVGALVVVEPVLYLGSSFGSFVLENTGTRARRRAALAAVPDLVTVAVVGAALAPSWGAAGALLAICAGQTAKSAALFRILSTTGRSHAGAATVGSVPYLSAGKALQ